MSIANEVKRISDAKDKIREQLIKLSPNIGVPIDVVATASDLYITASNPEYNDRNFINADGTGETYGCDASIRVHTKLAKGIYKFSYVGDETVESSVSVSDVNGNAMGVGLAGENYALSYSVYQSFAPNYNLKLGDDIIFRFSIAGSASPNSFSIAVQLIAPLDENSKIDECALALEHYVENV